MNWYCVHVLGGLICNEWLCEGAAQEMQDGGDYLKRDPRV